MRNEREIHENFLRIMREGNQPGIFQYIQALDEMLGALAPNRRSDENRISVCKEYIRSIRREAKRLEERVKTLEENEK